MQRRQFYEPEIQTSAPVEEIPPISNYFVVERPGYYLLTDDVSAILARIAERYHGEGRAALLEAARAFLPDPPEVPVEEPVVERTQAPTAPEPVAVADPDVARVEMFPNEDGSYWYARPVDADGNVLPGQVGTIDRSGTERAAATQWPGAPIYEVASAIEDSVWNERQTSEGVHSGFGRTRPSPRRLWGA